MGNVIINITVPSAYLSLRAYSEVTGIEFNTCRLMVRDGRIIVRKKTGKNGLVEVNMVAMLHHAIADAGVN